jgi:60 kDa SS-A/Ro ribonucleoprotein
VSVKGRAPKQNPALFALAAAASLGDDAGRRAALDALPQVARTTTHLLIFLDYARNFRGLGGQGMMKAVSRWYEAKDDAGTLAYQLVKYHNREGWRHVDVLRQAHPAHRPLLAWAAGAPEGTRAHATGSRHADQTPASTWTRETLPPMAEAYIRGTEIAGAMPVCDCTQMPELPCEHRKAGRKAAARDYAALIGDFPGMPWEALPQEALAHPAVWEALIGAGMPMTALIRHLPRLTRLGLLTPMSATCRAVCAQMTDPERLKAERVHPVQVLVAARTYASGHSARGESAWDPSGPVIDALDAAFYAAYPAVEPSGCRIMLAVDCSGSMAGHPAGGLPLTCREAAGAVTLAIAATEPDHLITGFTNGPRRSLWTDRNGMGTGIKPLAITPRQRLDDALRTIDRFPMGGTDCALPMIWALEQRIEIDTFVVLTDHETWWGDIHPFQALREYRDKTGIAARLITCAFTPTEFTIADPDDGGTLDISGFDSAVPALIADFGRGDI